GFLATALSRVAAFELRQAKLRRRILQSLAYPVFLAIAMAGCITILLIYVVPTMLAYLSEAKVELPLATRLLIRTSEHVPAIAAALALLCVAAIAARRAAAHSAEAKWMGAHFTLRL